MGDRRSKVARASPGPSLYLPVSDARKTLSYIKATGRWRSRSTSTVPEVWRLRRAKSSTPSTVGGQSEGSDNRRRRRRSVFRLALMPRWWLNCAPAAPPRATAMCPRARASRRVRRAQGATTWGKRSVKIPREHPGLVQKNFRTRRWSRMRRCAHGRSATVRS
jgi:hypothetical protein